MNLVPPYDVMCLHRRISTSCLLSSLSRFSPPTRIPRGLRAGVGGGEILPVGGGGARTVSSGSSSGSSSSSSSSYTRCVFAAVDGSQAKRKPGWGGQQPGLTGRRPLGRGS